MDKPYTKHVVEWADTTDDGQQVTKTLAFRREKSAEYVELVLTQQGHAVTRSTETAH